MFDCALVLQFLKTVTVEFLLVLLFDAPVRACFHAFRCSMRKEKVKKKPLIREPRAADTMKVAGGKML